MLRLAPITREGIVAEARTWIGTKWHHQAHLKGVGCDCGGLWRGVVMELGLMPKDITQWPHYEVFRGYSSWPDGQGLKKACDLYMKEIPRSKMQPGDVCLLITEKFPQHVGILGNYKRGGLSLIHCANNANPPRVLETRLMFTTNLHFVAAYAIPGVV